MEDHEDTLRALVKFLEADGARVVAALTAREAMAAMSAIVPAVALIDVQMPDVTGLDLLAWMKSQPRLAKVPVVLCSAGLTDAEIQGGMALGAVAYVHKSGNQWLGIREVLAKLASPPAA